jgi:hypothetical protein
MKDAILNDSTINIFMRIFCSFAFFVRGEDKKEREEKKSGYIYTRMVFFAFIPFKQVTIHYTR